MKRKIITKNFIALIKTINLILMFIFVYENVFDFWRGLWLVMAFLIEIVYYWYAYRILVFPNERKKLQLNKHDEYCYMISIMLSLVSTFVSAGAMISSVLALKYSLIAFWAIIVIVWIIAQIYVDIKILKAPLLLELKEIDFTKLTSNRVECTTSELDNVGVCFFALIIMSFLMCAPMFAIIFADNLQVMLLIYIIAVVLCNPLLLTAFYFLDKYAKGFRKKIIAAYLIYLCVQIFEGIAIYLVYKDIGWNEETLRVVVLFLYIISCMCLWVIVLYPTVKYIRAMRAYLQENNML